MDGRQADDQKRDEAEPHQGTGLGPELHGPLRAGVQRDAGVDDGEREGIHEPLVYPVGEPTYTGGPATTRR